jgi:hypothetical protein
VLRRLFIFLFLIVMIVAGISGCGAPTSEQVVCTPTASAVNVYNTLPQTWTNAIFQYAVATPMITIPVTGDPSISASELQLQGARYGAFQYLIAETQRWSDIETIKLDDSSEAQIIVTFISPKLLQAVFLSEVLSQGIFYPDFDARTQTMLSSVADRNELLFLLTITTTNNGNLNLRPHTIDIPMSQMDLVNGEDLQIVPNHDDHNLDQPIQSSSKPVFGYFAYPLAVLANDECKWILEPKYNTNIVITVPTIQVDGVNGGPYTWTIPYSPLIHVEAPPDPPVLMKPPEFDQNLMSSLAQPPSGINQTNNWQDFARFVWGQIMQGNY